ncbi:MAG: hypothetical protein A3J75_00145 [Acidobacteria bacterium RBG_16_68_9]|nr:MAG: hypothetical protein A3J75_00145 [Acidobacteria bacterium RBG_16_68_9]
MDPITVSAILTLGGGLVAILKWLAEYFSAGSQLKRREVAEARRHGQEAVEAERLRATYARIDREPAKTGDALVEEINRKLRDEELTKP